MDIKQNYQVRLAARPEKMASHSHWDLGWADIVEPSAGEVLVEDLLHLDGSHG